MTLRYATASIPVGELDGKPPPWPRAPRSEWAAEFDALTRDQSPLADAAWIEQLASAFELRPTLHAVFDDDRVRAVAPMMRLDTRWARAWVSLDNEHCPYWLISGTLDGAAAELLLARALATVDYLFFRRLPMRDPNCGALICAARRLGLPVAQLASDAGDARITLAGGWSTVRSQLAKNYQRDLPRKQRQLARLGALRVDEHTEPGERFDSVLAACFELETHGWKGQRGSPIVRDRATARFYGRLAPDLAARGRFVLYTLVVGDRIVAFEYCLRGGRHLEMLKLSFDPALERYSPGHVLRYLILEREAARSATAYYHLGRPSPWKLRWASEVAPLCTLRIYAPTARGRAAHLLGPVVRGALKQLAGRSDP